MTTHSLEYDARHAFPSELCEVRTSGNCSVDPLCALSISALDACDVCAVEIVPVDREVGFHAIRGDTLP
jgi:hypothetical protein